MTGQAGRLVGPRWRVRDNGSVADDGRVRRLYGPTLVVGLLGAVGAVVGSARSWASATASVRGLPTIQASVSGSTLEPAAGALAVVVLAGFGAVIATRGWVRRGLGMLLMLASLVIVVQALRPGGVQHALRDGLAAKGWTGGGYATSTSGWRWLVVLCALATTVAGAATGWLGGRWAVMGSRYDAPEGARAGRRRPREDGADLRETDVWQAIDRGDDPTAPATRPRPTSDQGP